MSVTCKLCLKAITDPDFKVILCQEEYPDIEIGPYCEACMSKIKICSGCQHPVVSNETFSAGQGDYFCSTCWDNLVKCDICHNHKVSESIGIIR